MQAISILCVDDHDIVFQGLKLSLNNKFNIKTFENCLTGDECLEMLKTNNYDLIILDVNLPDTDSQNLLEIILVKYPNQKVLVFSMSPEEIYAKRFIKNGAYGYLSKDAKPAEVVTAVSTVLMGRKFVSMKVAQLLADDLTNGRINSSIQTLTEREFEIMRYFLGGLRSKDISQLLNLHSSTIGTYKINIFNKLGVNNMMELAKVAKLNGIEF
ncbi:MAG TPA: response regulator transcription factor [Saprospiraceae bacterium]|jgi:DNA-binding NarL/FixJ family response regulator|nr:response regulator transcription factor [Saprospiraceae bacterium]